MCLRVNVKSFPFYLRKTKSESNIVIPKRCIIQKNMYTRYVYLQLLLICIYWIHNYVYCFSGYFCVFIWWKVFLRFVWCLVFFPEEFQFCHDVIFNFPFLCQLQNLIYLFILPREVISKFCCLLYCFEWFFVFFKRYISKINIYQIQTKYI